MKERSWQISTHHQSGLENRLACKQHEQGSLRREHRPARKERPQLHLVRGREAMAPEIKVPKRRPEKSRGGLRDEDGFNYPIKKSF